MTLATSVVGQTLYFVLYAYTFVLLARVILDWVQFFARDWRPSGVLLVLVELVYSLTDPPIRLLLRIIPPIRLGGFALEFTLAFLIVYIVVRLLMVLVASF